MKRKEVGFSGEKIAKDFLKKKGYRIRETNYRCREGEIDIIAEKDGYLVFIEVRTKSSGDFGIPEETITQAKKERVVTTALTYLSSHQNLPPFWRFDVVAIELDKESKAKRIEIIENAI